MTMFLYTRVCMYIYKIVYITIRIRSYFQNLKPKNEYRYYMHKHIYKETENAET